MPCLPALAFLITPIPQARLFSLQSSIVGCPSCQGPLRLLWKIFLSDTSESVFAASSLPGPAANPVGRKIISLPVQDVSEGK
ncbi:nitrate ABC transporter permease [Bacteroides thetaiotaomicron]